MTLVTTRAVLEKLRGIVFRMPVRIESLSGQQFGYLKQSDVIDWIDAAIEEQKKVEGEHASPTAGVVGSHRDLLKAHPERACDCERFEHCAALSLAAELPRGVYCRRAMPSKLEQLETAGNTGADMSPGDPLAKWAHGEIVRLTERWRAMHQKISLWSHEFRFCGVDIGALTNILAAHNPFDFDKQPDSDKTPEATDSMAVHMRANLRLCAEVRRLRGVITDAADTSLTVHSRVRDYLRRGATSDGAEELLNEWVIACGSMWYGKDGKFVTNECDARGFSSQTEATQLAQGMRCPWTVHERGKRQSAASDAEIQTLRVVLSKSERDFERFHRQLCDRFNYAHDPQDWKRDQVSLIEWIAKTAGEEWRGMASKWLEAKAVEQEQNNQRWPAHAAEYLSWRQRPEILRMLARDVLTKAAEVPK